MDDDTLIKILSNGKKKQKIQHSNLQDLYMKAPSKTKSSRIGKEYQATIPDKIIPIKKKE